MKCYLYGSEIKVDNLCSEINAFLNISKERAEKGDDLSDVKSKGTQLIEKYVEALRSYSDERKEEARRFEEMDLSDLFGDIQPLE